MKHYLLLLALLPGFALADVYKTVRDGEVIYSDQPAPGAEKIQLPELPSYRPPPLPRTTAAAGPAQQGGPYDSMAIMKPANDATIRNNLGIIQVQVRLEPALKSRSKHRIQYYLDGQPHGPPIENTGITFSNITRGEHTISAVVLDEKGSVLIRTESVTVHVKRESKLNPVDRFEPSTDTDETQKNPGDRDFNPNVRSHNPNARSANPNARSTNPNVIGSPPPAAKPGAQ